MATTPLGAFSTIHSPICIICLYVCVLYISETFRYKIVLRIVSGGLTLRAAAAVMAERITVTINNCVSAFFFSFSVYRVKLSSRRAHGESVGTYKYVYAFERVVLKCARISFALSFQKP